MAFNAVSIQSLPVQEFKSPKLYERVTLIYLAPWGDIRLKYLDYNI